MNYSSLSATDRRVLMFGGIVAITALVSFLDPSGSWGPIMALTLLAGLGAVFVGLQTQIAPSMTLPAPKGLLLLILGGVAAGGTAIAMLTYLGYISRNLADIFVLIMIVGLVAALALLWTGWTAYRAETPASAVAAAPAATAATAAPAASPAPSPTDET